MAANPESSMLGEAPCYFTNEVLPLIHGPAVKIRIEPPGREFIVSKDLLGKQSDYFAKMFDGKFSEGKHNEATLKVIEGVVSLQSFEMLLQWLYIGQVTFYSADPGVQIDAAIELARLADMCAVHALEAATAKIIKKIILVTADYARRGYKRNPNAHTYSISSHNIQSATMLPQGHQIRSVLAGASFEGYLTDADHKFRFFVLENPQFKADLICELDKAFKNAAARTGTQGSFLNDPISGKAIAVNAYQMSNLSRFIASYNSDAA